MQYKTKAQIFFHSHFREKYPTLDSDPFWFYYNNINHQKIQNDNWVSKIFSFFKKNPLWKKDQDMLLYCYDLYHQAIEQFQSQDTVPCLIDGVEDLLKFLHRKKIPLAICSNQQQDFLLKEVESLGVTQYFDCVLGLDSTRKAKPSSDLLEQALFYLQKQSEKKFFIGDTISDYHAAQEAGFLFIGLGKKLPSLIQDGFVFASHEQCYLFLYNFFLD